MYGIVRIWAAMALAETTLTVSAQDLRVPSNAIAGDEATISTTGSGRATFYLLGPGVSRKSDVILGEEIHLHGQELKYAGSYLALACASSCASGAFYVTAAKPASLKFLLHPSRA